MREKICINSGWSFEMNGDKFNIDLPHTWNAFDGQSGVNGYDRGRYIYRRKLEKIDADDLKELERILWQELGTKDDYVLRVFGKNIRGLKS